MNSILLAAFIPLLGTAAGSAFVFFVRKPLSQLVNRCFSGIAAGVMTAASVWSLLIPAMEQSEPMGRMAFCRLPAVFCWAFFFCLCSMPLRRTFIRDRWKKKARIRV